MNEALSDYLEKSKRIVFFGGAGVSTESGIPDFRSKDGLYHQKYKFPPETILSHGFFIENPTEFYKFYREKILIEGVLPNKAHIALAQLEKNGSLSAVVTQNIDGLHQAAGSQEVFELHGSVARNHCTKCGRFFGLDDIKRSVDVPFCDCGGIIKPDVVLYDEQIDPDVMEGAIDCISKADLLIVGGTSLNVYPAAGLIRYYTGKDMIIINKTPTSADRYASLVIREPIGVSLGLAVGV